MARRPGPHLVSEIVEAAGARYAAMQETSIQEVAAELPPIDLIIEATGSAEPGFAAMEILGNNGVLVLLSGTGRPAELTVPATPSTAASCAATRWWSAASTRPGRTSSSASKI